MHLGQKSASDESSWSTYLQYTLNLDIAAAYIKLCITAQNRSILIEKFQNGGRFQWVIRSMLNIDIIFTVGVRASKSMPMAET